MSRGETKRVQELKHKARRRSIKEGLSNTIKNSFATEYVSPFAIAINSSGAMVSMISSVSGLLGQLSQMFSPKLMEKYSRKKIVLTEVIYESLSLLPFIAIALLYYFDIWREYLPFLMLLTVAVYVVFSNISYPAWFSWMGDIVDRHYRGRWFSKRRFIIGIVASVFVLISAFVLDIFRDNHIEMIGFAIFFFIAFLGRLASFKVIKKEYEPKMKMKKHNHISFLEFLSQIKKTEFGRFSLMKSSLDMTVYIASPLFAVYLLRDLQFSYTIFMIITLFGVGASLFILSIWGMISDKYGSYKVITLSSMAIPFIPIMWLLSPNPIYLMLVPSLIGGVAWAGQSLATGNFIYESVPKDKLGSYVYYFNLLGGIGVFIGAGIGALLIKYLSVEIIKPIFMIFIISSVARFLVVMILLPRVKKTVPRSTNSKILKEVVFKDAKIALHEDIHQIIAIRKYLKE